MKPRPSGRGFFYRGEGARYGTQQALLSALPKTAPASLPALLLQSLCNAEKGDWHMDVPTGKAREPSKTTLFEGEMQVRQDASSCSFL
jgi:hypothetical protein